MFDVDKCRARLLVVLENVYGAGELNEPEPNSTLVDLIFEIIEANGLKICHELMPPALVQNASGAEYYTLGVYETVDWKEI